MEAMFRLHRIAADCTRVTVLAPDECFVDHAMDAQVPFAVAGSQRTALKTLAGGAGADLRRGRLQTVDVAGHSIVTDDGELIAYDVLLVAVGALPRPATRSLCFGLDGGEERMHGLIQDVEEGYVRSIGFVVPAGATHPIAVYELALMTADRARGMCQSCDLTLVTAEPAPLAAFGSRVSLALAGWLHGADVSVRTAARVEIPARGVVELHPGGEQLRFDRIVSVPVLDGPAVDGLPHDSDGFLAIDRHGCVLGTRDVYAAGDVTNALIKHRSAACQQADTAADAIAAHAGVAIESTPTAGVLEGVLLTEHAAMILSRVPAAPRVVRRAAAGWPPAKAMGRELARHLAALAVDEHVAAELEASRGQARSLCSTSSRAPPNERSEANPMTTAVPPAR